MKKLSLLLTTSLILLSSFAANAVLNMGGKTIFSGTVIEVLEPGPATQIQTIITNITDASASNPYLIQLGPGVYDLGTVGIIMKEWVSIQGSGQEATKITGAVSAGILEPYTAIITGANNTALMDLTIENTGGDDYSIAIFNKNASPLIVRVTATASGGTNRNVGVSNSGSSPIMKNVTASALSGVGNNTGVRNESSNAVMMNVTARASGGPFNNHGVNNFGSSPIMENVTASASDGAGGNYGVSNDGSSPTMTNVTAIGSGGADSRGISNATNSAPFIQNSMMEGGSTGMLITPDSPDTRVVNSKIIGGVIDNATGTQCRGNYDANFADVTC